MLALLIALLLPVGWAIAGSTPRAPAGLGVWIDQPLDGTVITTGSVVVTAHIAHPSGATHARLRIRDTYVSTVDLGGSALETVEFTWDPPVPGVFEIAVEGQVDELWGTSTSVWISVVGDDTESTTSTTSASTSSSTSVPPTTTLVPSLDGPTPQAPVATPPPATTTTLAPSGPMPTTTTSPPATTTTTSPPIITTTTTTTTTPCANAQPVVTGPFDSSRGNLVTWSYSGCTPGGFGVILSEDEALTDVVGQGSVGPDARSWAMPPLERCRDYFVRVAASFGRAGTTFSSIHHFVSGGC